MAEFKKDTELQFDLLNAMNLIVMNMNHEGAQDLWFYTWADGADEEEVREWAEDGYFDEIAEAFFRVCKAYGKDGLCTLALK